MALVAVFALLRLVTSYSCTIRQWLLFATFHKHVLKMVMPNVQCIYTQLWTVQNSP